eukprot:scaffold142484_cov145-Phaeocystis_antarctica.AAC.1
MSLRLATRSTSSKGASKRSKDDDGKTSTELVTEAISKGRKQDRTLRAIQHFVRHSKQCHALRQRCNSQLHQDRGGPTSSFNENADGDISVGDESS